MSTELWIAAGIGAAVLIGLVLLGVMMLAPNRALPTDVGYQVGDASRRGLLNNIVAGI